MSRLSLLPLLLVLGCPQTPAPVEPTTVAIDLPRAAVVPRLDAEQLEQMIAFLADDAQQGRPPGSEADARVQAWIVERMQAAGLEGGAGDGSSAEGFVQPFEVGDGARLRAGQQSKLGDIAHAIVPFGHDTGEAPVVGKLVFVGHGITGEGEDAGDFAKLDVRGAIVVAQVGSVDPHVAAAKTRPQSKLIAARDRGAVGFVLWSPESDSPWPNHGQFGELGIPAVFVGKSGSAALRSALRAKPDAAPKLGASSKAKLELATPIEPITLRTANVIGVLRGSAAPEVRRQIVIGAHMDHLGLGTISGPPPLRGTLTGQTSSSLAPGEQAIHNGADDNASGVAVVLALAGALATLTPEQRPHDLVFVAFGAEEMGLLGSKHFVEALAPEARAEILAMLNFDMVGRLRDASNHTLSVNGSGTANEWAELLARASTGEHALKIDEQAVVLGGSPDGWGPSDHASFYGERIPVLHFFTGSHADYHKPSDDLDKLDFTGAAQIGDLAGRVVLGLLELDAMSYIEVARPSQGRTQFRVSLGTMPDYGRNVDGLAISGVREGSPAATAGLRKDDVIKRIGTREIHNIDDYMACFGELEPGVEIEIEWERDGQRQTGKLVPAAPRAQ